MVVNREWQKRGKRDLNCLIILNKIRKGTTHYNECSNFISYIVAKTVYNVNPSDKIVMYFRYIAFIGRQQKLMMYANA